MKRISVVGALLFLGFFLAWSPAPAQAAAAPTSTSQDPAQLSTAALVPVKYSSSSGTDTILVLNASENNATTTTVRLRFYNASCALKADAEDSLTKQDIHAMLFSDTFATVGNGVVLADQTSVASTATFAISAVIIDFDIGFIYERQGSPLLLRAGTSDVTAVWGGFTGADIDDYYIGGYTTLQFVCPGSTALATEMNRLASVSSSGTYASAFDAINVYDYDEGNKRSMHGDTCKCFTDTSDGSSLSSVISAMALNDYGTIHADVTSSTYGLMAWRIITDGTSWTGWDARLRTYATP